MGRGDDRSPQVRSLRSSEAFVVSHCGDVHMSLVYGVALAEARSCLAALADGAIDFDEAVHFEQMLLDLDDLHGGMFPALYPLSDNRTALLNRLEDAVDRMLDLGGDEPPLEVSDPTDLELWQRCGRSCD